MCQGVCRGDGYRNQFLGGVEAFGAGGTWLGFLRCQDGILEGRGVS